jgi:hypothetical protein
MVECRARASEMEQRPRSRAAAITIAAIWIVGAASLGLAGFIHWR